MKVFLSSPFSGLEAQRKAVCEALELDYEVIGMEHFGSSGLPSLETCLEALALCRACVLIIGGRYGSRVPNGDVSYTEAEFENALSRGIQVFAYIEHGFDGAVLAAVQTDDDRTRQREFKMSVESELVVDQAYFTSAAKLAEAARRDVDRWATNKKRPQFRAPRSKVKNDLAYVSGRVKRAAGMLFPYPIVLVDVSAAHLEKYPPPTASRLARKVHDIYWELDGKGAQIVIFNDLPVTNTAASDVFEQRLAAVKRSNALVICFARRQSDIDRLMMFDDAGDDRALWIEVTVAAEEDGDFAASMRQQFTGQELTTCEVGLHVTEYLTTKITQHVLSNVAHAAP